MTVCTANRMFPLFFQLLLLMRERECKYLSSFSLLFIYSINFWWIDVFFRKWKNIITTKVNRQYYGSLETDIICFMEKFVYETGSWTINLECHNGLYKCAVWTLFAKTLSPIVLDNFDVSMYISEETNNSVFEYYSNNIRILTICIRIRPFFRNE